MSNKIRLRDQKHGLDGNNPSFFIVPVMELEKAKNWKGESYRAIFLIGKPKGDFDFDDEYSFQADCRDVLGR